MQTVRASEANRQFSKVLKQVSEGEEFLVVSRGRPVATISPVRRPDKAHSAALALLFERLHGQKPTGARGWSRDALYERKS